MLVRKKVAKIKANQQAIRNRELAFYVDHMHPMNRPVPPANKVKSVQPNISWPQPNPNFQLYRETPRTRPNLTPHLTLNNIQWLINHGGEEDIVNTSRYLSGVVRPPPPPFRLPRPFHSLLLRTATAFVRRRFQPRGAPTSYFISCSTQCTP